MNNKRLKTGFTSAFKRLPQYIASGVFGTLICFAVQANAQDLENEQAFSISSQPLYSALTRFTEQSGIQFVYDAGLVKGLVAPNIINAKGKHLALGKLLDGSGLSYRFTGTNTVVLYR